jgi:hypothetical protein
MSTRVEYLQAIIDKKKSDKNTVQILKKSSRRKAEVKMLDKAMKRLCIHISILTIFQNKIK